MVPVVRRLAFAYGLVSVAAGGGTSAYSRHRRSSTHAPFALLLTRRVMRRPTSPHPGAGGAVDQRVTRTAPIRAANVKKFDEDRMNSMMQSIVKLLQTNSTKQRRISFKAKTKSDVIVDEVARNATVGQYMRSSVVCIRVSLCSVHVADWRLNHTTQPVLTRQSLQGDVM